jgi:hypothetical protein
MSQPPGSLPPSPYRHPMRKRLLWPWFVAVGAMVFIAAAFVFAFWVTSGDDAHAGASRGAAADPLGLRDQETQLRQAFSACSSGDLADQDHTLVVDTEGDDYGSGSDSFPSLTCTLDALHTPQSVIAQMEATRALDGMRSASWDDFTASWTYHPDAGLDVILTEKA